MVASYLEAVGNAANSVAVLSGEPLTERRFLLEFPQRAEALGQDRMYVAVTGLLGGHRVEEEQMNLGFRLGVQPTMLFPRKLVLLNCILIVKIIIYGRLMPSLAVETLRQYYGH